MVSVLLRTAAGTVLFVAFLWLVRIDDYRVAGMMLTFPMLNGMALVSARENARKTGQSMVPIVDAQRRHVLPVHAGAGLVGRGTRASRSR